MKRVFILIPVFWTIFIIASLLFIYRDSRDAAWKIAKAHADETLEKDLTYRLWATNHGGVYVPVTAQTPANPYLAHVPERDIVTPSGRKLTLVNPAFMTRQVHELGSRYGLRGHISSLKPVNPVNTADPWERASLLELEKGKPEVAALSTIDNAKYLRLIRPLKTEQGCLKCHAEQGYKVGDIRGGISVSVPWDDISRELTGNMLRTLAAMASVWILGLAGLRLAGRIITDQFTQLEKALAEVKTLTGLLPICASCKKIRNDKGFWQSVEKYISTHTEARFSHGICPDCGEKLYGEFYKKEDPA